MNQDADHLIGLRDRGIHRLPVEHVAVDEIAVGFSPRTDGEDPDYVHALAETEGDLPPILVHRPTMTVVDGIHRLRVAAARGESHIAVRFFDGDRAEARLLAIALNVVHGRPLTSADRTAAARQILLAHPRWSDRAVGAVTGLSGHRISQLRKGTTADTAGHRVGRDGRVRPVDSSRSRERAGELLRSNPGASLRQIAAQVGLAPATVADVRNRLLRGDPPVPGATRTPTTRTTVPAASPTVPTVSATVPMVSATVPMVSATAPAVSATVPPPPPTALDARRPTPPAPRTSAPPPPPAPERLLRIFDSLRRDPSLRLSESGRNVLRVLSACTLVAQDREGIAAALPEHCKEPMAQLAHGYARLWTQLARELDAGEHPALSA
ncbi:hypothetical protein [Streptomyces sp. NPDC058674]|uniref:hypothetical protein n=1 Tax=Streptomyces sp. NPDC058674 TaxID=3346592 RepID=UPI00365B96F9